MEDDARRAIEYYETNRKGEILELADRLWPTDLDAEIPAGMGDICFFLRSTLWSNRGNRDTGPCDPANRDASVEKELWHARAMTAAVMTDERHTVARLLLQHFFILMELRAYSEARSVLGEMLRLVGQEHELRNVFMRLHEEKRAFSFFAEGRYGDAIAGYTSALRFCEDDPRGTLKVEGGLVLSRYLERLSSGNEEQLLVDSMRQIRDKADAAGYEDVANDASCNLEMMETGLYEGWCPFELL